MAADRCRHPGATIVSSRTSELTRRIRTRTWSTPATGVAIDSSTAASAATAPTASAREEEGAFRQAAEEEGEAECLARRPALGLVEVNATSTLYPIFTALHTSWLTLTSPLGREVGVAGNKSL